MSAGIWTIREDADGTHTILYPDGREVARGFSRPIAECIVDLVNIANAEGGSK